MRLALLGSASVGVAAGLTVVLLHGSAPAAVPPRDPGPVIATALPGLVAPTDDPVLTGFASARPRAHTVAQVSGPFDDRFTLTRTRLVRGTASGVVTVTSDVSEVIDLQVQVGFYDAAGHLLGTGAWDKHGEGARPDEVVRFSVTAPSSYRSRVVAAAVGVPVLVNE